MSIVPTAFEGFQKRRVQTKTLLGQNAGFIFKEKRSTGA